MAQTEAATNTVPARTLSDDVYLLAGLLGEVLQSSSGDRAFALTEEARSNAKALRGGDQSAGGVLDALVHDLSADEAESLVRSFTNYFQLINLAEDSERIRRIRAREMGVPGPRRGSVREAIGLLAERGAALAGAGEQAVRLAQDDGGRFDEIPADVGRHHRRARTHQDRIPGHVPQPLQCGAHPRLVHAEPDGRLGDALGGQQGVQDLNEMQVDLGQ